MKTILVLDKKVESLNYYHLMSESGDKMGEAIVSLMFKSGHIENFCIKEKYRRQGYGVDFANKIKEDVNVPLSGCVLSYYAARFWASFDSEIPTNLSDDELEKWCYHYGWFTI